MFIVKRATNGWQVLREGRLGCYLVVEKLPLPLNGRKGVPRRRKICGSRGYALRAAGWRAIEKETVCGILLIPA